MVTKSKARGQSLVEFALILPILLLLLLGIIEGARIIWAYVQVQNAAREAARYAVTGQPYDDQGDPWSPAISDAERVVAIKQVAVGYTTGLDIAVEATTPDDYDAFRSTPAAFGVLIKGQRSATDAEGEIDYAGKPGLNVLVQVYYNVRILDPIYATILPQGWVRINAQLVMQNEGVDTTASGLAPVGLGAEPPPAGEGDAPPGSSRVPKISIAETQPVPTATTITILLEDHQPGTDYDVFFDDQLICTVAPNAQFFAECSYYVPVGTSAGEHSIHSELPGSGSAVASALVEVVQSENAAIDVAGGTRWPAGSPITIRIFSHDPNTTYKIRFAGNQIGTITTDGDGNGSLPYTIPSSQPEGSVFIESLTVDETFSPANTEIMIISPEIVVQGGTVWPPGTRIYIFLLDHAPGQTYSVYFGDTLIDADVTTNSIGEAILSYVIPSNTTDGPYVLKSKQGDATIATLNIQVETPPYPFILIVGGYEWPAGSAITIQLRKHSANMSYDVYFGPDYVGQFTMDSSGQYSIAYIIPGDFDGTYRLYSVRTDNDVEEASVEVTVSAVTNITVDGGLVQAPGADITIRLNYHAPNAAYDVYLGGVKIGTVITDGSGEATLAYTIPVSTIPGDYTLESKPRNETTTVAENTLHVRAPDLRVSSIETPANLQINSPIPITITITNESDKPISNQYFDVDLYVDPTLSPTVGDAGLPPGVRKYWYDSIPANGTLTIDDTITLWGAEEHELYARADTSGNIIEADEDNNILGKVVASTACGFEVSDEFAGTGALPSTWLIQNYGDADPDGDAYLENGALALHSEGRSTWMSDDDSRGFQFVYNQQQVSGDFDVYVQVLSHESDTGSVSGKAGLEIRKSLDSQDVKLDWVTYEGYRLQGARRSSSDGSVEQIGSYISPVSMPVWLRIVRQGDEFSLYYATVSTAPPEPGDWIYAFSETMGNMGPTVNVGLINASYVNNVASTSEFDHFHLCGDPAGTTTCGEVKETGGAVFIDARNYTDNISRGGKNWVNTARSGLYGMHVADANAPAIDASQAPNDSPELQYQVKFASPGRYYIALLGWGPDDDSNSVHMGLGGTLTGNTADIQSFTTDTNDPPEWIRDTGWYIDIPSVGSYTINLYVREDGAQVYKIALFTQADYPLDGFGPSQSECTATAPQDIPPGFAVCNQVLVNGDFEGDLLTEVYPYWVMAEQELVGRSNVHYITPGTSFGVIMPSSDAGTGTPKQPWMYQEFVMPDWVLTNTTAVLDLQKAVDWLGTPNDEPLYFYLRSTSGITLTDPLSIATGQDFPDIDPFNYNNTYWSHVSVDVFPYMAAAGYDPVNFASQALQAYFFSPNPGSNSTEFYLDKVNLEICTTQPLPDPIENSLGGTTRVNQVLTPGVDVWAYKMQSGGGSGGPVYTTFSIQDGTYHFYNLPPGTYLVYAEYFKNNIRYTYQTVAVIPDQSPPNDVTRDLNLVLP